MAIIKMSGIGVTELSGKFGGSVGGRNQSGNILRNRVKGTNPQTTTQIEVRAKFSGMTQAWRGLTAAERLAWNAAAASGEWPYRNRLGESRQPSGFQLWSRLNYWYYFNNDQYMTAPPLKGIGPTFVISSATLDVTAEELTFTSSGSTAGFDPVVFATASMSSGVSRPSDFRKVINFWNDDPPGDYVLYTSVFGTPIVGSKVTFWFKAVSLTSYEIYEVVKVTATVTS